MPAALRTLAIVRPLDTGRTWAALTNHFGKMICAGLRSFETGAYPLHALWFYPVRLPLMPCVLYIFFIILYRSAGLCISLKYS